VIYREEIQASGFLPTGESMPFAFLHRMKTLTAATETKVRHGGIGHTYFKAMAWIN
jgi:hypothetical protein